MNHECDLTLCLRKPIEKNRMTRIVGNQQKCWVNRNQSICYAFEVIFIYRVIANGLINIFRFIPFYFNKMEKCNRTTHVQYRRCHAMTDVCNVRVSICAHAHTFADAHGKRIYSYSSVCLTLYFWNVICWMNLTSWLLTFTRVFVLGRRINCTG